MIRLPENYAWLYEEAGPKMLQEFIKLYGIKEVQGPGDNPEIMQWALETRLVQYKHDLTPWCGLAMAVIAQRAGKVIPRDPLWALNWINFGIEVKKEDAMLGDILVFKRTGGGHVGMYIGEDDSAYHVAGGNEADMMNIVRMLKSRLYAVRRPKYNIQPPNVRKVYLASSGTISSNEQ